MHNDDCDLRDRWMITALYVKEMAYTRRMEEIEKMRRRKGGKVRVEKRRDET